MELSGLQGNAYRELAEEIGEVLQAAASTAERLQDDGRIEAALIRADAEGDRRSAYAEGRRILDDARMDADMVRAEAQWQSQETLAMARREAAERIAGADNRLAELNQAEQRVIDRLASLGQMIAEALAGLRAGSPGGTALVWSMVSDSAFTAANGGGGYAPGGEHHGEHHQDGADRDIDREGGEDGPTGKVYFVEFPAG